MNRSRQATALTIGTTGHSLVESMTTLAKSISKVAATLLGTRTAFSWSFQVGAGNTVAPWEVAGSALPRMGLGLLTSLESDHLRPRAAKAHSADLTFTDVIPVADTWMPKPGMDGVEDMGVPGAGISEAAGMGYDEYAPSAISDPDEPDWGDG